MDYDVYLDVEKKFPAVWRKILASNIFVTAQETPVGVLLGGQPGAGKSFGTTMIKQRLSGNVVVINGDEFRPYKQGYKELYEKHGINLADYTNDFSNLMIQRIRDEAIKHRFNLVIEGTFRNPNTPLSEIKRFRTNGYIPQVIICTCPKELSWQSTIERGDNDKKENKIPRYVAKQSHDIVVANLAKNVKQVFIEGKLAFLEIYSRQEKLFDSKVDDIELIERVINDELNRKNS